MSARVDLGPDLVTHCGIGQRGLGGVPACAQHAVAAHGLPLLGRQVVHQVAAGVPLAAGAASVGRGRIAVRGVRAVAAERGGGLAAQHPAVWTGGGAPAAVEVEPAGRRLEVALHLRDTRQRHGAEMVQQLGPYPVLRPLEAQGRPVDHLLEGHLELVRQDDGNAAEEEALVQVDGPGGRAPGHQAEVRAPHALEEVLRVPTHAAVRKAREGLQDARPDARVELLVQVVGAGVVAVEDEDKASFLRWLVDASHGGDAPPVYVPGNHDVLPRRVPPGHVVVDLVRLHGEQHRVPERLQVHPARQVRRDHEEVVRPAASRQVGEVLLHPGLVDPPLQHLVVLLPVVRGYEEEVRPRGVVRQARGAPQVGVHVGPRAHHAKGGPQRVPREVPRAVVHEDPQRRPGTVGGLSSQERPVHVVLVRIHRPVGALEEVDALEEEPVRDAEQLPRPLGAAPGVDQRQGQEHERHHAQDAVLDRPVEVWEDLVLQHRAEGLQAVGPRVHDDADVAAEAVGALDLPHLGPHLRGHPAGGPAAACVRPL
eukprot:CAMPEP_0175648478 /NCGR_PEP_ID=MMETSP0097-20121207/8351_1 /TAXON_ID=311494 /ORGANISM="Alexandrium monilatum, Strain CCMP3105" /LENGTH=537 /DNA_ID=CAMNT_0016954395 /DNA_START=64 /DNA_END=1674 /DNA_ORIENTATION=+